MRLLNLFSATLRNFWRCIKNRNERKSLYLQVSLITQIEEEKRQLRLLTKLKRKHIKLVLLIDVSQEQIVIQRYISAVITPMITANLSANYAIKLCHSSILKERISS